MKQSPLIEAFAAARKNCMVEYDIHKTSKHSRPDPTQLLLHLSKHIASCGTNVFKRGRHSEYEVESLMEKGMDLIHQLPNGQIVQDDLHRSEEPLDAIDAIDEIQEEDLLADSYT